MPAHPIIDALSDALGERKVLSDEPGLAPYLNDERGLYQGSAACLVFPESTEEVAAIVRLCAQHDCAVVPQGGNTG